uniref:Uncharacterized protein n=1 Tax=Anguilla anguilla TaxID=7936 RepID=A0A0E9SNU3_ANGAN
MSVLELKHDCSYTVNAKNSIVVIEFTFSYFCQFYIFAQIYYEHI